MAKKNGRDDPPKPQVAENEQMSDIILILDKMELILQAVSQIDKDGRYKTVPADKEHTNSFLKIDRYASMFENFLKNFWSQLKDPTRFGILTSLKMMEVMMARKQKMSQLCEGLNIYPQVLQNVRVADKAEALANPEVQAAVDQVTAELGDTGRILVRESGTEPVIRVMVEAESEEICQKYVDMVVAKLK